MGQGFSLRYRFIGAPNRGAEAPRRLKPAPRRIVPFLLFAAGAVLAPAHDVITTKLTWSAEISRIVYRRCASCHREGGSAMSLTTYEEARPWAKAIRDEVLARRMPPWGAVKGYGEFQGDISLTQDEITRIAEWVEGGAPEGDPKYLPASIPPVERAPAAPAGRMIRKARLAHSILLLAIRPAGDAADAKVFARLPNGGIEPLIWLHCYKQQWNRTFVLSRPLALPAGTEIVSEPRTAVDLLVRSQPPAR